MTEKPSDELELQGLSTGHQAAQKIVNEAADAGKVSQAQPACAEPTNFPGHNLAHGLEEKIGRPRFLRDEIAEV